MSTVVDRCADRIVGLPRPLLLAFDVDGTLAPIVARPERARVPTATRRVLAHLAASRGIDVALVTGRDAASLRRVVRVARVWRALEHGRLVVAPGERLPCRATLVARARPAAGLRKVVQHTGAPSRGAARAQAELACGARARTRAARHCAGAAHTRPGRGAGSPTRAVAAATDAPWSRSRWLGPTRPKRWRRSPDAAARAGCVTSATIGPTTAPFARRPSSGVSACLCVRRNEGVRRGAPV